jgi:uncharacterized membrane protein (UPF0127 family)
MRCASFTVSSILCALFTACSTSQPTPVGNDAGEAAFRIPVSIASAGGEVTFQAEIADTPEERNRGLMFRESMGDREGMLFLFHDEQPRSFWMRNTLIPLDMIFVRTDRTILGIVENAEPKTETSRAVEGASQFVLEINGGLSQQLGIAAGQTVTFMAPIPSR